MDCARVDEELIAFHLAALDGATRAAVEAHLTGCARCVSSYLALKRAVDAGEDAPAPSQMARARVRAEAERQLALVGAQLFADKPSASSQQPSAAERKQPEKKRRTTWALVATAAAAMVAAPFVYVMMQRGPEPSSVSAPATPALPTVPVSAGGKKGETVDTARVTPENLAFL